MDTDTGAIGPVNVGDERADARRLDLFTQGWRREAVRVGPIESALGLIDGTGRAAVELDDFGRPIPVGSDALALLRRVESRWPMLSPDLVADFATFAGESLTLRYWLMERLDAEGEPPEETFAILPWDLVDRAVDTVMAGLEVGGELGEQVEIRHWVTPAVHGLTGAIEQLDHGLRTGDTRIARLGVSGLLGALRDLPLERVPDATQERLGLLATRLGEVDSLYRHMAAVVRSHLTAQKPVPLFRTTLHSRLVAAAGTARREHIEVLGDDLQQVRVERTQTGRLRLAATVARHRAVNPVLGELTDPLLPIRVLPRNGRSPIRVWVALSATADRWSGRVNVAMPDGLSDVVADFAPVDPDDLADVPPEVLLPSLRGSDPETVRRWLATARRLPEGHTVRMAVRLFTEKA